MSKEEKDILDVVIEKLGKKSKNDIVNFMHKEQAYVETAQRDYTIQICEKLENLDMLRTYK